MSRDIVRTCRGDTVPTFGVILPWGSKRSAVLLRTARENAGLSQSELALRSGVAQSVVSAYEAGKRQPVLPTLAKLIAATGHTMAITVKRIDSSVRGLPDTPLVGGSGGAAGAGRGRGDPAVTRRDLERLADI